MHHHSSFPWFVFGVLLFVAYATARIVDHYKKKRINVERLRQIQTFVLLNPKEFEEALGALCKRDGCSRVKVTGGAGDRGADVVGVTPDGRRLVIQAKHYGISHKVGSPDMQRFAGTAFSIHRADVACLVTTSTFTRQAAELAADLGIMAFDATLLAAWAHDGIAPWGRVALKEI